MYSDRRTEHLSLRLSAELKQALQALADREGRSTSNMVVRLIEERLGQEGLLKRNADE